MADEPIAQQMTFGICTHCGKEPATRMPMRLCKRCSDELFNLPPGSKERRDWFNEGVVKA